MATFQKIEENYETLTDEEKVALFKSTSLEEPTIADLATIGPFKVLIYSEDV